MKIIYTVLFFFLTLIINAQKKDIYQSIESVVEQTHKTVSVKAGQKIDTTHLRTLFLPTANFTMVWNEEKDTKHETMSLNAFIESLADDYYTKGFFETGKGQIIDQYKGVAQVMQTFYGEDSDGEKGWGINSYQLIYSNNRWWIANMVWTMSDEEGKDIPKKYLKN